MAAIHETAYPRIKPNLSHKELKEIFTPTKEELILLDSKTEQVKPEKILAVTFTRTAAGDLKKKLQQGIAGAEKIHAMTLHSFCFGLLNRKDVFDRLQRRPRRLKTLLLSFF